MRIRPVAPLCLATLLIAFFFLGASIRASASEYPDRPIYLVISYAAGSSDDILARQIVPKLSEALGQDIIVQNKPGAGGTLGSAYVSHARPDGYTLVIGNAADHGLAPNVYKELPYDPVTDFTPIVRIATAPYVLAVSSKLPVKSVKELVDYAHAHPGKLNFGSTGVGTGVYLAGVRFAKQAGIDMKHVPYNSIGELSTDFHNGTLSLMFYPYQSLKPMEQSGDIRVIASTGSKRAAYLPDTPTMEESGFQDFDAITWFGLYGPKGLPQNIVQSVYAATTKALADPSIKKALFKIAVDPDPMGPVDFGNFTRAEVSRFKALSKAANVVPQ